MRVESLSKRTIKIRFSLRHSITLSCLRDLFQREVEAST